MNFKEFQYRMQSPLRSDKVQHKIVANKRVKKL